MAIAHLAFLTPGSYAEASPLQGLNEALDLFALGEALGYQSAWVRQRHLERGVSSATTFLAAASQRTQRIALGTAVIQMGYENPFRLAEDLATVDVLAQGRLQVGLSAGAPPYGDLLGERLLDGDASALDFSHARVQRLRENLRGDLIGDEDTFVESPAGRQRPRVQPHAPGLAQRLWYGGGSLRSARWAGENGYHLLVGNLNRGEQTDDFFEAQRSQLALYHAHWAGACAPRVALGRVIVPLDGADASTRARYRAWAASRHGRTLAPQGERRTLFARDLVGTADEILEHLRRDPIVPLVQELRLELPYDFSAAEYTQILRDTARLIAPELGWVPASAVGDYRAARAAATSRPSSITAIA
ncbi:LLM class flavin-dependent oxidoreductase [Acidovorax sp. 1608163]|uniref:LLM class flavin-dependent oxidoreductase n=1 Tax=Acidovorax sp. 1608163 TaxID=2478662 RepID=UPI000EF74C09|nr:LLM class flavin-dependent oxidoreductase [Acidovorax sp. 1608163]AYM96756.1 LLM class flavin-dependent oxidoreductase [Acidovorax sp. 1608163]